MDGYHQLHLLAELDSEHCHLNHGPGVDIRQIQATDYLVVPVGHRKDEGEGEIDRELVIPVCVECAQALMGHEWTLFYCLGCNASRWVYRKLAKNRYRHHVLWLGGCPDCGGEFRGLWFTDFPTDTCADRQAIHQMSFVLGQLSA